LWVVAAVAVVALGLGATGVADFDLVLPQPLVRRHTPRLPSARLGGGLEGNGSDERDVQVGLLSRCPKDRQVARCP
jgi:hypothetical protein